MYVGLLVDGEPMLLRDVHGCNQTLLSATFAQGITPLEVSDVMALLLEQVSQGLEMFLS